MKDTTSKSAQLALARVHAAAASLGIDLARVPKDRIRWLCAASAETVTSYFAEATSIHNTIRAAATDKPVDVPTWFRDLNDQLDPDALRAAWTDHTARLKAHREAQAESDRVARVLGEGRGL